jgi:hypothetical protein
MTTVGVTVAAVTQGRIAFALSVPTTQEVVLNTWILRTGSREAPMPLNAIVGLVDWAVNIYQTSGEAALPQKAFIPAVAVEAPKVASLKVPATLTQEVPELRVIAPEQASFAGWAKAVSGKKKAKRTLITQRVRI